MDFFGLTQYGVSDPIKYATKPDHKEPVTQPTLLQILMEGDQQKPFSGDMIRELDIYSGILNGFSYKSANRIQQIKKRGYYKSTGPTDTYRYPLCTSMNYGWWLVDPKLRNENWYKSDGFFPKPTSNRTRFVNRALLLDKKFIL